MPIIQIKLGAAPSASLSARVAERVSGLTHLILGKSPNLISIALEYVAPGNWFVGGASLGAQERASYFLDIKITDETNTRAEKARYIAEIHRAMGELLGPLHEESYVHVHDVRAEAYGYGGRTQAARHHAPG